MIYIYVRRCARTYDHDLDRRRHFVHNVRYHAVTPHEEVHTDRSNTPMSPNQQHDESTLSALSARMHAQSPQHAQRARTYTNSRKRHARSATAGLLQRIEKPSIKLQTTPTRPADADATWSAATVASGLPGGYGGSMGADCWHWTVARLAMDPPFGPGRCPHSPPVSTGPGR